MDRPRECQPHTFFSDILLFADLQHSPGQPAAWAVAISEEKTSRGKTRWKKGKRAKIHGGLTGNGDSGAQRKNSNNINFNNDAVLVHEEFKVIHILK